MVDNQAGNDEALKLAYLKAMMDPKNLAQLSANVPVEPDEDKLIEEDIKSGKLKRDSEAIMKLLRKGSEDYQPEKKIE
jgi:hypothetical protein